MIKPKELNTFFNALLYYTRIPVSRTVECNEITLSKAFRYFPLIGIIVGFITGVIYLFLIYIFPVTISALLAIIISVLLTGALHEDGLADFCDGFGGGKDKESILRIMKDSHIGTYGVISLILLFLLKFILFCNIPFSKIVLVITVAAAISRFFPILLIKTSVYARDINSKSLHTKQQLSYLTLFIAALFSFIPAFYLNYKISFVYSIIMIFFFILYRAYLQNKIGGFTGDTLGALQQIGEIVFYLTFIALI